MGIYRQDYCGCRLSRAERDERVKKENAGSAVKNFYSLNRTPTLISDPLVLIVSEP